MQMSKFSVNKGFIATTVKNIRLSTINWKCLEKKKEETFLEKMLVIMDYSLKEVVAS